MTYVRIEIVQMYSLVQRFAAFLEAVQIFDDILYIYNGEAGI